ncbi:MAG: M20 family metallopeptidase [Gammaproteobacteria bacterium]|nr:M20 family metallopeptidase [Gammaproteobacteria bacterium]MDH3380298.1 M20 family metallopeptidase [Gammaproteobacteria bacterium]
MKELDTIATLCDMINLPRMVEDLKTMISIPSMNPFRGEVRTGFREKEMAEFYCDQMAALGLDVGSRDVVPGRPNVWGVLKGVGSEPSLMLSGHLDTVGDENYPDAFVPKEESNRVYGRGSCDMKSALAGYLEVVRVIREADIQLKGNIVLTGIADEEDQMIGSKDLGANGPWADYGIIGEPSNMTVCSAHKGQVGYLVRSLGRAVHSSRPEEGVNAIEGMIPIVEALLIYRQKLMSGEPHVLCGHGRCCPSVIRGGTIISTVPDYCELEVDRRTLPGETREDVYAELRALIAGVGESYPQFRYEIDGPTIDVQPLDVPTDSPVVNAVLAAIRAVTGKSAEASAFFGGTDAPHFGFPTVIYGAGSLQQAHSINEFVETNDMMAATQVYLRTVLNLIA